MNDEITKRMNLAFELLNSVEEEMQTSKALELQVLLIHLRQSVNVVRDVAKFVPQLNSTCAKTARLLETIYSKAQVEYKSLALQEKMHQEYKDYSLVCPRCFQHSHFLKSEKGKEVCSRCGLSLTK